MNDCDATSADLTSTLIVHARCYCVLVLSEGGNASLRLPFVRTAAIKSRALLSSTDDFPIHR